MQVQWNHLSMRNAARAFLASPVSTATGTGLPGLPNYQINPAVQFLTIGRLIGNAYRLWSRNGPLADELHAAAA
jgi:hypothetical protein